MTAHTSEGINPRILKNMAALLASQVYIALTALVLATRLPRYLGEMNYGLYSEIYAFVGLFDTIGHLGLRVILTREVARHKNQALYLLGQVFALRFPLALVAIVIVMVATLVRPTTAFERILILICIIEGMVRGYSITINAVLRAFEMMEYNLVITLVDRTLAMGTVLAAIYLRLDLATIFLAFLISALGQLLVATLLCWWRIGRPKWGMDISLWKRFINEAWPVGLSTAMARTYDGAGLVLLGAADGATGLLAGALRINRLTAMLGTAFTDAMFPVLARSSAQSEKQTKHIAQEGLSLLLGLVLPLAAFYAVFSEQFIPWFLGPEFTATVPILVSLSPALVFSFLFVFLTSVLIASGQQRLATLAQAIGLGVNVTCNLLLIPRYGALGPALALLISQATSLVIVLLLTNKPIGLVEILRAIVPAALGTTMMVIAWKTFLTPLPTIIQVLLGGITYCCVWGPIAMLDPAVRVFAQRLTTETVRILKRRFAKRP